MNTVIGHKSDCATHNEPMNEAELCDCGGVLLSVDHANIDVVTRAELPGNLGDFLRQLNGEKP